MTFTSAINTSLPTGTEAAGTLDDIIREVRVQMKERFDSLTTGSEIDPMRLKAGAIPSGYAITNANLSTPTLASPTFTGTPTGFNLPALRATSAGGTSYAVSTWNGTNTFISSVPSGNYIVIASVSFFVAGGISGGASFTPRIRINNNVNTNEIEVRDTEFYYANSDPIYRQLVGTQYLTLASTATVTLQARLDAPGFAGTYNILGWVTATGYDTSLTMIKVT